MAGAGHRAAAVVAEEAEAGKIVIQSDGTKLLYASISKYSEDMVFHGNIFCVSYGTWMVLLIYLQ